ncbi:MAG: hypothetical protein HRU28_06200 [Rhizobiales bacterium]|nr:hypothetical protein [Hyphomicrobiales bacterium]
MQNVLFSKNNLLVGGIILLLIWLLNPFTDKPDIIVKDASKSSNYTAETLLIDHFVGKIELINSPDDKIHIKISNYSLRSAPKVSDNNGIVEISTNSKINKSSCVGYDDNPYISINGQDARKLDQYPVLEIQAPITTNLIFSGIAHGNLGNLNSLKLNASSCSNLMFADVKQDALIKSTSSADIIMNNVGGNSSVNILGSGNVAFETILGNADFKIHGSGSIAVIEVKHKSNIDILGSGSLFAERLNVSSKLNITGSGDIEIGYISGGAALGIVGSGSIAIDKGKLDHLSIVLKGNGHIKYGGTTYNYIQSIVGSGDIFIANQ